MRVFTNFAMYAIVALIPVLAVALVTDHKRQNLESTDFTGNFATVKDLDRELLCMTRNIYYEAGREPAEGKIAVAQVVMNRVAHPEFPNTPCEVIHQRRNMAKGAVCQFTWLCDGSVERNRIQAELWEESRIAAKKVLLEGFRLPSLENALFYHADYVKPNWRKQPVATIGRHIFYQHPRPARDT